MGMILNPDKHLEFGLVPFSWWRQIDGKEFVIIGYTYDLDLVNIPVTGIKILMKYESKIKAVPIDQACALVKNHKWSSKTVK